MNTSIKGEFSRLIIWDIQLAIQGPVSERVSEVAQSCPTVCDPMDCSLPGFSIHGILQARILEWVAISFSNAWKWKVKVKSLSRVRLFATLWTVAYQAPPSMGFSRQEYWSGVPLPSPPIVSNCSLISLPFSNLFTSKPSYNPSDHTSENTHLVTLSTLTFNILPLTIT